MKVLKIALNILCCILVFTACNTASKPEDSNQNNVSTQADPDTQTYREPYPEYCVEGNQPDIDPYTIEHHAGDIKLEGRSRGDVNDIKINSFSATLRDNEELKKAGIKNISVNVKVGYGEPKFKLGIFNLEPYAVLSTEDIPLPDIMVFLSDFDKSSTFEAVMQPDVEAIKKSPFYSPDNYPSYIIEAASLTISHVEDVVLDDDEKKEQAFHAKSGMVRGKQYVKGAISFTIKKFGSKGANFGPKTFTFASVNEWAYFPDAGK